MSNFAAFFIVQRQINCASHLKQARSGAIELESLGASARHQELFWHRCGRCKQPHGLIVQGIYEDNKTLRFIAFVSVKKGNMVDENRIKALGDGQKVRRAKWLGTEVSK